MNRVYVDKGWLRIENERGQAMIRMESIVTAAELLDEPERTEITTTDGKTRRVAMTYDDLKLRLLIATKGN